MDFIISRLPKRHKVERSTVGDAVQLELCVQCSSLDFKRFFDNERVRLEDFDHSIPDYRERVSMELVKRGHRKCSLCNDFFKIFNHFAKDSSGKPQSNLELFIAHSDKSHKIQRMFLSDARKDEWLLIPLRQSTRSTLLKGIDDLHGRRNRVRGPRIDYDLVKAWMEDCRANHGECTARNKWKRPPTSFRAIDCRTRQLRSLTVTDRYAALSYVWAQIPEQSQQSGERIGGLFPRLIEDAIAVTLNLGILFLWVDRYCITVFLHLTVFLSYC